MWFPDNVVELTVVEFENADCMMFVLVEGYHFHPNIPKQTQFHIRIEMMVGEMYSTESENETNNGAGGLAWGTGAYDKTLYG